MNGLVVDRADEESVGDVAELLERSDLPTDGVRSHPERFYVARHGGETVGVGGLELYGQVALLRSVAVEPSVRGTGFGTAVCGALERRARERGVETVSLLTTTAEEFFRGRGYEETARTEVPESIRETEEFSEVCPSTATCFSKSL